MINKFSKNEDLSELYDKKSLVQGDHPSSLNPLTDTTIFCNELKKNYRIFIMS